MTVSAYGNSAHWIQTFSGLAFDLAEPTPDMVAVEDIAHSLSLLCRYTGHCAWFYSVAQHSILVSEIVAATEPRLALAALLHDAEEAYVGDWSSPLKAVIRSGASYALNAERAARSAVERRFGLTLELADRGTIKAADLVALVTEKRDLFGPAPRAGWGDATGYTMPQPLETPIQCIPDPAYWELRFLERFHALGGKP